MQRFAHLGMVALVLSVAGCDFGGISREAAIKIATQGQPTVVLAADRGTFGQFASPEVLPDVPRSREVWAIRIKGSADATTTLVVLDFRTGARLSIQSPAP